MKIVKPGQLITFEHVVYRAKKAKPGISICRNCDLQERCPVYKRNFYCSYDVYFKRLYPKQ